jgi:hypothetical protein
VRKLALTLATVLLAACSRDIQNTEAVRKGIVEYLNTRSAEMGLDMNLMDLEVTSVSFEQTKARAIVMFRPKGMTRGGMSMSYSLDRQGDKWIVTGRQMTGGSPHGAPPESGLPPGHPPAGSKQ